MFTFVDRGIGNRSVIPAKSAEESTIRPLLTNREKGPLTVYTDGFRAYDPLNENDDVHVNTFESHVSLLQSWLLPHRGISKDKLTQYLRAFQLRRELLRKPGRETPKPLSKLRCKINKVLHKSVKPALATSERLRIRHQRADRRELSLE